MSDFIKILVVEDNKMSREMLTNVLLTKGYTVFQAGDGTEAIKIIEENHIHLALVDVNMSPMDGLAFRKHLVLNKIDLPTILITSDPSTDMLSRAIDLGVLKVLQKPVQPSRLLTAINRVIDRMGFSPDVIAVEKKKSTHAHEDLMKRAIDLAGSNARAGKGRPFGAVVADKEGHILGSGTNGITSQADPSAHAEIMAIRQAAEKLGRADLSDCALYCSSEPTMIGRALIVSVGIKDVYYGLTHDEVKAIREDETKVRDALEKRPETQYKQLCHDAAADMLKALQDEKVA